MWMAGGVDEDDKLDRGSAARLLRRTYGYLRWEILAALINGSLLLLVCAWIIWEAVGRLRAPEALDGGLMFVVAALGLVVNVVAAAVLGIGYLVVKRYRDVRRHRRARHAGADESRSV